MRNDCKGGKDVYNQKMLEVSRNMIIQSQCDMMLNHMREHGSITSREAMYDYGIGRASGRVYDLRKRGYDVETTMETGVNRYGILTRYARYTLHEGC